MRYNLGYMDKYPIEAAGSVIENTPMYRVFFKKPINPITLEAAFYKAMERFPLFKTKVKFDSEYYLEDNDAPLKILKSKEEDRPSIFGNNTNGYPWRTIYYEDKLCFEWLHGVSDGVGALNFLKQVLCDYFGVENNIPQNKFLVASGLEPFFDNSEKGKGYHVDPQGFSFKDFPKIKKRGYKTDCHELRCDTSEILEVSKICESSVSLIVALLFSKALRLHLKENVSNKNVACNVVLDLRRPLNYETMHNCVDYKRITYQDRYDKMSFKSVAKEYKNLLDNARIPANVIRAITQRVSIFKLAHILRGKKAIKLCLKLYGLFTKDTDCNFVVTYPGKIELPEKIKDEIDNIDFKVWHDYGECIIACVDYNGQFNVNISENFVDKGVVEDFIEISDNIGVHFTELKNSEFTQSHFEE